MAWLLKLRVEMCFRDTGDAAATVDVGVCTVRSAVRKKTIKGGVIGVKFMNHGFRWIANNVNVENR